MIMITGLKILQISSIVKLFSAFYQEKENPSFIDFLTGLRGTMALSVILHHSTDIFLGLVDNSLAQKLKFFFRVATFYGVFGFFLLSSFLLTYRLYSDLQKDSSKKQYLIFINKLSKSLNLFLSY